MAPTPGFAAIGTDTLWCLGLGLLVAVLRDAVGLAFGNGKVQCFVWDMLAFTLAALLLCGFAAGVSASGIARWYMAGGIAAGALAWHTAASRSLHRWSAALAAEAARPWRALYARLLLPAAQKAQHRVKSICALHRNTAKKHEKKAKTRKKQLQKPHRVLYN